MGNRKIGYYWVKYPVLNWQTAMWNGREWFVTGHNKPIKKIDNVGDFIDAGGRNAPASTRNCNIHIVSQRSELLAFRKWQEENWNDIYLMSDELMVETYEKANCG